METSPPETAPGGILTGDVAPLEAEEWQLLSNVSAPHSTSQPDDSLSAPGAPERHRPLGPGAELRTLVHNVD